MQPIEPLALNHSWPLVERDARFAGGIVHEAMPTDFLSIETPADCRIIGTWRCHLADETLEWNDAVFAIFGFPKHPPIRAKTIACYAHDSRIAMERLRAHAIQHRRGFTLDCSITALSGAARWMRLITAPEVEAGRVIALHGLKQDVTHLYR
ncbi:MAG: hypothetical protein OSB00_12545 [Sphingomonas bacterium]|mgnify:CR=1 FL=1|nr:hypothetical protein [Sphingomonas bacterium]